MKTDTLTGDINLARTNFDRPSTNPLQFLKKWFNTADELGITESRGLVLSTVSSKGKPSSRVVLIKEIDDIGITFTSSQTSQKIMDISKNPLASGALWWRETIQQVNFSGIVKRLPNYISDKFFAEREREAQAVASCSKQSCEMIDEVELCDSINKLLNNKNKITRPKSWHAYHIVIDTIEFWQGNPNRFHERLRYDLENGQWCNKILQP